MMEKFIVTLAGQQRTGIPEGAEVFADKVITHPSGDVARQIYSEHGIPLGVSCLSIGNERFTEEDPPALRPVE